MSIHFPDDYNKLCPHGGGLLPLPVSTLSGGQQHPYAGTLFSSGYSSIQTKLSDTENLLSHLPSNDLWTSLSPQMLTSAWCLDQKFVRMGSVPISFLHTPAIVAVASTTTISVLSAWVRTSFFFTFPMSFLTWIPFAPHPSNIDML